MKIFSATILLAISVVAPAAAQDKNTWTWRKAIPAGQTVEIRNVTGDVKATAAAGNQVEIVARKSNGDPESVRIEVDEHSGGVIVCALYDDRASCDNDRGRGDRSDEADAQVDFEVRIPRGVKFIGGSVSGNVEVAGLDARVKASTVSGNVRVSTSDIASASSVSGSIHVRMGRSDWDGRLGFSTVSGDIDVEFGSELNADVQMSTVSGDIDSDWPLSVSTARRHAIRGRIGSGGRELAFSTVSGSVQLRKAQ